MQTVEEKEKKSLQTNKQTNKTNGGKGRREVKTVIEVRDEEGTLFEMTETQKLNSKRFTNKRECLLLLHTVH